MKRAMRLTVDIEVDEGDPGHPSRFKKVIDRVTNMLEMGAREGVFDHTFVIPDEGYQSATVRFTVAPCRPNGHSGNCREFGHIDMRELRQDRPGS